MIYFFTNTNMPKNVIIQINLIVTICGYNNHIFLSWYFVILYIVFDIKLQHFSPVLMMTHISRFGQMFHSFGWGRPPLQHSPTLPLRLDGILQLRAAAPGPGALPAQSAGPQGASVTCQRVRRGGRRHRHRAVLRTAAIQFRLPVPGLPVTGSSGVQRAGRRRLLHGCEEKNPRRGNQVREWLHVLRRGVKRIL